MSAAGAARQLHSGSCGRRVVQSGSYCAPIGIKVNSFVPAGHIRAFLTRLPPPPKPAKRCPRLSDAPSSGAAAPIMSEIAKRQPEPLLDENPDRFCMFPIKYPAIWEMYKKA